MRNNTSSTYLVGALVLLFSAISSFYFVSSKIGDYSPAAEKSARHDFVEKPPFLEDSTDSSGVVVRVKGKQIRTNSSAHGDTPAPFQQQYYYSNDTIYGHVHVAKSGGSSLIYELASKYENICSNKAISKNLVMKNIDRFQQYPNLNRVGVYTKILDQCKYISSESGPSFWERKQWLKPLELHVPCKDPLELLMSNCYFPKNHHVGFKCDPGNVTDAALERQINECFKHGRRLRFDERLYNKTASHNITLKCFDTKKEFTEYMEYIDARLEHISPRKEQQQEEGLVTFQNGKMIPFNRPSSESLRNKTSECIWKDQNLQKRVRKILFDRYIYFRFCDECLQSSNDLLMKNSNKF